MIEFGKTLRAARESKGLTPGQIAEKTHMMVQMVEGLEKEDFSKIVAPIYGRIRQALLRGGGARTEAARRCLHGDLLGEPRRKCRETGASHSAPDTGETHCAGTSARHDKADCAGTSAKSPDDHRLRRSGSRRRAAPASTTSAFALCGAYADRRRLFDANRQLAHDSARRGGRGDSPYRDFRRPRTLLRDNDGPDRGRGRDDGGHCPRSNSN